MPDGMDPPKSVPLDGVTPPSSEGGAPAPPPPPPKPESPEPAQAPAPDRKKILLMVLAGAGAFFLFYLFFAFYLLAVLPDPEGARQGLKIFGNLFYGLVSVLSVAAMALIALRMLRSGMDPNELPRMMIRPGIAVVVILGLAMMVFIQINQKVSLPVDIMEPENVKNLTAPVTVTFGTDSLRHILRNQNLAPAKYKWDFNGDGQWDAETQEHTVTTVYERKGDYNVRLLLLLNNGKVRSAWKRLSIPKVMFAMDPVTPVADQTVIFDLSNVVDASKIISSITWDFNADEENDLETQELTAAHTFSQIGTFNVQATIQYEGGLQETFTRSVTVLKELDQPFDVYIESGGDLQGSTPLGLVFTSSVEEGVDVQSINWRIVEAEEEHKEDEGIRKEGERVSYVFEEDGEYRVILKVTDSRGRVSSRSVTVNTLEPLELRDIVITGTPKPSSGKAEGVAPLEVRFSASSKTPLITFNWEQENASAVYSTEDDYRALYEDPGTYQVVLIAQDDLGRMQKTPIEITVLSPRSSVSFTAIPSTGIVPLNVTFDASDSFVPDARITGFSWTFGDSDERQEKPKLLGAKTTHRYEKEGTFTVTVRALTEDGRSFDARKTIVVRSPILKACILPSRTTGRAPMGVRFDASCSTGDVASYLWSFGDGATSEQTEPIQDHVFEEPGSYTVLLEVSDGEGDFDEETIGVTVEP